MQPREDTPQYCGPLAAYCTGLIKEKRALGYRYRTPARLLAELDRFSQSIPCEADRLTKEFVQAWVAKRPHESAGNRRFRIGLIRQLAMFMVRQGAQAYVQPWLPTPATSSQFTPYIFTPDQIRAILAATDRLRPCRVSPRYHVVMPAVFRILYGCGLRASEVCGLRVRDVDLQEGVLKIYHTKFDKDRLAPMAPSLSAYLRAYARDHLAGAEPDAYFFAAPDCGPFSIAALYGVFRRLLWTCGISHGGTGRGPRLHDLRHTFAVHCLQRWVREGKDLTAALPVLSTYLGHNTLYGTQRYLRLTAQLYPEVTAAVERHVGKIIPERNAP